eukprot:scaffold25992_cov135-Isochrysis_galbana.AAC.2
MVLVVMYARQRDPESHAHRVSTEGVRASASIHARTIIASARMSRCSRRGSITRGEPEGTRTCRCSRRHTVAAGGRCCESPGAEKVDAHDCTNGHGRRRMA